ncbi:Probable TonB-dependent receptor NMB1497 precursor [Aggregatibacter aphrophilus]|uniref:Probable TonB-dependent receptor NMB1497 n=1 Tax=Aggregatibacter aphrophilus TaxID=732 RepID=A0A336N974_AGGAP|nr:Probable TonB-dependent receptor NMB1497 precursor [Aggregatibacter aphrophilus]
MDLKTTLGFNFFKNEYSKNRFPEELSLFYDGSSQRGGLYDFLGRYKGSKGLLPQKSSILHPSGEQKFHTFYLDTSLTRDIYRLDYSVNFIKYKFNGEYAGYYNSPEDFEKAFGKDSQIYKNIASLMAAVKFMNL